MNKEYLRQLSADEQVSYVTEALPDYEVPKLNKLASTILERVHNQVEIKEADAAGEYAWAFSDVTYETSILKWKNDDAVTAVLPRLTQAAALLSEADFSSTDTIKASIWDYAEEIGRGEILWPLRISLSGREQSPDPFTCAYVLGKGVTLARIQAACDKIK
jgi:glutamyl/glutaminyl-tRNA synthetase